VLGEGRCLLVQAVLSDIEPGGQWRGDLRAVLVQIAPPEDQFAADIAAALAAVSGEEPDPWGGV
jgi:hypothetical protein